MKCLASIAVSMILLFVGCTKKKEEVAVERGPIYFNSVPADSSGITFSNDLHYTDDLNIIEYLYYYNGGGVAIGDINNDGLEDIYLSANQVSDRLYLNLGNLKFKDITKEAGMAMDSTWSTGVTMEDVNNDGLLDIYVCKGGNYKSLKAHNLLYINQGNGTFVESASAYGLDFSGFSTQASFFDYDRDGDMDMYLLNHSIHTPRSYGSTELRKVRDSLAGDKLYENRLEESIPEFIDVTAEAGIYSSALGYGLALATSDLNDDGLIDIYVGNDFHENDYLYINQGDKTFKESISDYLSHTTRFTMGVDIADINNDRRLDILTLDMMPFDKGIFLKSAGEDTDKVAQIKRNFGFADQYARNTLQLNRNDRSFSDVALMTETYATDWSWCPLIQDYDNDGLSDIYVTNGIYKRPNDLNYINYLSNIDFARYDRTKQNELERKLIEEMPTMKIPNIVFRNKGDLEFERLTVTAGQQPSYSNGAAYGDLDNDGDLDIVVNNIDQDAFLLENTAVNEGANNFISFTLKGDDTLKNTTGSKLYVYGKGKTFFKELSVDKGFQSASTHRLHFGLGTVDKIDSVTVNWLDGTAQTERAITINQENTIIRKPSAQAKKVVEGKMESFTTFPFFHQENNFLDYEREPLMPEKLSSEGPAAVQVDFNGDGLEDLFIGGAKYQSPSLYFQGKNGEFVQDKNSNLAKDIVYEDVDAAAFDMENDGDMDLYVMSGGNDNIEGHEHLEDRIYVNDGNGRFKRLEIPLVKTNGGSISTADFDGDGFQDLFIGNRSIPGGYGLSPFSYILKNDGTGKFGVLQQDRIGMVTDSQWADLNNDGLLDLVIVGDWMPVTILINQGNSKFLNETRKYGLENTQGMWNTITITDVDSNGYNDIIAGNAGLNFKWKASPERPVKLYLDDFDGNKQSDPLIFYDFFGKYVPFASKDRLTDQMPSLKKKFLDYTAFSKIANVTELTGKAEADILEIKKITELRSMTYLNMNGGFKGVPLPKEAQMSTIEDFHIQENDGKRQLIFVGNYLDYTTELGQSDANSGGVLSMDEKGNFGSFQFLPLPSNLNSRKIIKLDKNRFLVVSSNGKSYIFGIPEGKKENPISK